MENLTNRMNRSYSSRRKRSYIFILMVILISFSLGFINGFNNVDINTIRHDTYLAAKEELKPLWQKEALEESNIGSLEDNIVFLEVHIEQLNQEFASLESELEFIHAQNIQLRQTLQTASKVGVQVPFTSPQAHH